MAFESTVGRELGRAALQTVTNVGQTKQAAIDRMTMMQQQIMQQQQRQDEFNQSMQINREKLNMDQLNLELNARIQAFNEFRAMQDNARQERLIESQIQLNKDHGYAYRNSGRVQAETAAEAKKQADVTNKMNALSQNLNRQMQLAELKLAERRDIAVGSNDATGKYVGLMDMAQLERIRMQNPNDPRLAQHKYTERKNDLALIETELSKIDAQIKLNQGQYNKLAGIEEAPVTTTIVPGSSQNAPAIPATVPLAGRGAGMFR